MKNILVPLDGSDQSERIGRWAGRMARGLGVSVTLLGVPSTNGKAASDNEAQTQESQDYLSQLADKLKDTGVEARVEVRDQRLELRIFFG